MAKNVAIVYFGMARTIQKTAASHKKYLRDVLTAAGINYKIYFHTWLTDNGYRVWDKVHTAPADTYWTLLEPNVYKCENQDHFTATLPFHDYFYEDVYKTVGHSKDGEWLPYLVLNHICAMESQRRALSMIDTNHDAILLIRPDAMLEEAFPVDLIKNMWSNTVYIPDFKHNEGYNDRMALGDVASMSVYMNRIKGAADYRRQHGRIVAEKYLKYTLQMAGLIVMPFPYRFEFIRPN